MAHKKLKACATASFIPLTIFQYVPLLGLGDSHPVHLCLEATDCGALVFRGHCVLCNLPSGLSNPRIVLEFLYFRSVESLYHELPKLVKGVPVRLRLCHRLSFYNFLNERFLDCVVSPFVVVSVAGPPLQRVVKVSRVDVQHPSSADLLGLLQVPRQSKRVKVFYELTAFGAFRNPVPCRHVH